MEKKNQPQNLKKTKKKKTHIENSIPARDLSKVRDGAADQITDLRIKRGAVIYLRIFTCLLRYF
jgi:hypothetical protein